MGIYLNSTAPYDRYKTVTESRYFVDKSQLLGELIPELRQEQRFFCITRPRRFGKTVMANMVGAFFGKAKDSRDVFEKLEIAKSKHFQKHLNAHDVIYIDFSETPEKCESYGMYINRIAEQLKEDLCGVYSDLSPDRGKAVWDILTLIFEKTGDKFIFVFDEWDAVFHMPFITEADKMEYLHFLKVLLKGRSYVELAYITGILPIAKYSDGSELNAFLEYNMATRVRFCEYFGFTDSEVDQLYEQYRSLTV
ncbi:MAG: AAA family ATPase, partial [Lachnospiraceae bacterium]|nr:AAA family ATPase [Lachnospiraceae bacterium]